MKPGLFSVPGFNLVSYWKGHVVALWSRLSVKCIEIGYLVSRSALQSQPQLEFNDIDSKGKGIVVTMKLEDRRHTYYLFFEGDSLWSVLKLDTWFQDSVPNPSLSLTLMKPGLYSVPGFILLSYWKGLVFAVNIMVRIGSDTFRCWPSSIHLIFTNIDYKSMGNVMSMNPDARLHIYYLFFEADFL